jgi:hypothetical protein
MFSVFASLLVVMEALAQVDGYAAMSIKGGW